MAEDRLGHALGRMVGEWFGGSGKSLSRLLYVKLIRSSSTLT